MLGLAILANKQKKKKDPTSKESHLGRQDKQVREQCLSKAPKNSRQSTLYMTKKKKNSNRMPDSDHRFCYKEQSSVMGGQVLLTWDA